MKNALASNKFKAHNNKSKELVASKFHSTLRNVRIVINTGLDKNTGKAIAGKQAHFKAVFINNQSQWRTIATGSTFKGTGRFGSALTAIEVGADEASTCKRCGVKNFKAKSGNVVCANACWTRGGGYKKSSNTKARTQAALARAASRTAVKQPADPNWNQKPDERKQIADHYATITVGQLVKIVQDSGEVSPFVGMVTQVKSVSGRPHELLKNVSVQWMHNGVTESLTNYCKPGIVSWLEVVA
jgi:uncharacterized Zn finger protein (UPF0148 family)